MTKEELAAKLNGRKIGSEITVAEIGEAKAAGLLVVFGASDDLCELRGVIDEELGAYKETMFFVDSSGRLLQEVDDDDIEVLKKYNALGFVLASHDSATKITAHWNDEGNPCWTYETAVDYATFDILEDDEVYCRGIVIAIESHAR